MKTEWWTGSMKLVSPGLGGEDPPMMGERGCCCAVGILGKIRHVCCTSSLVEGTFYRRLLSIRYRMRLYLAIKDIVSHTCLPTRPIHSVKEAKPQGSRYPGIPHMMHLKSSLVKLPVPPQWDATMDFLKKAADELGRNRHQPWGFWSIGSHTSWLFGATKNTSNRMGDVSWAFLVPVIISLYIYNYIYNYIHTYFGGVLNVLCVFFITKCCVFMLSIAISFFVNWQPSNPKGFRLPR